jgi:hypothetical protein
MGVIMKVKLFLASGILLLMAALWIGCSADQSEKLVVPEPVQDDGSDWEKGRGGTGRINTTLSIPAHVQVQTTAEGCTNNPGPYITLTGELSLGGVNGRLIFSNNKKRTHVHEEDVMVDVVILQEDEVIRFNKQPPLGGVGGNPYIFIQFLDGSGDPISDVTYLGRCVQGLDATELDFGLSSEAEAVVTTGDCDNSGGPNITLNGELRLGGIDAKLIFTNSRKFRHRHDENVEVSIVILPAGESIEFAKQPPRGGAGGNPHIFFMFTDGDGEPMSREWYLGRCVQLGR